MEVTLSATCVLSDGTAYSNKVTGLLKVLREDIVEETIKFYPDAIKELPEPEE